MLVAAVVHALPPIRSRSLRTSSDTREADGTAFGYGGDAEYVPVELAERIFVAGEHPVRVWREHRGLTLGALAKASGIAQSYVSEIEHGKKRGSVRALAALAKVLRVDIEDLLAPER